VHEVIFVRKKDASKLHTLTTSLGLDGGLVFDEGDYFLPLGVDPGREMDTYLSVHATYKVQVLRYLTLAFEGISDTCGETLDERLLCVLQNLSDLGHWQTLGEVEAWLQEHDIPFSKQHWSHVE
jgi:hypothetical protein